MKNPLVWASLSAGVIAVAGCNKVPLLAPGASTITLSSSNTIVQANGTAQVSATILEQGGTAVHNGTTVTFTTTLGALSPTSATTVNGVATTVFSANGQSGIAEIRAISGGAKLIDATAANPGTGLKLTVGGAAASRVAVTANPSTLPFSGGSSTIVANVVDASGNPLSGVTVTFSTTAGALSSAVATTDSSGNAQTTLTTNKQAVVTATAGGAVGTAAAPNGSVTVGVNAGPASVTITVSPSAPFVGQPVAISVTAVAPASGGSPVQRILVDFGDGASTTVTGSSGGTSHAYTQASTYVIRATAFDQFGDSGSSTTTITVVSRQLAVTISSSTSNPTPGSATAFAINATPTTGNQITSITINFGDGSSTQLPGNATSVQHVYAAGTFTVTATANDSSGATGSGSTVIVVAGATAANFTFQPNPGSHGLPMTFDGSSSPSSSGIASYSWIFGDSTSGSGVVVSHTYILAGSYTVTLTVVDNAGRSASISKVVVVN